ncbi:MAG: cytochrome b/b6 domain-containing protein [Phycisphaeraceae bacterium]|nr:cytochrome b/b6 domain-containing protein [Phycisphaeraceae bacterium]
MKHELIYSRFNRFWHWTQAMLVVLLGLTGFDIHFQGLDLFGFETAVMLHRRLAWVFVVLIAFAIFWHFTTSQWRQYLPTRQFLLTMVRFYLIDIFRHGPHPVRKTAIAKFNPLQKLTYLGLKVLVIPVLVSSGFLYYYYNQWGASLAPTALRPIALMHTVAAYGLTAFMCAHIYLTTTGRTLWSNIWAMITGWELTEDDSEPTVTP